MLEHIFKLIRNRRKANAWILVELLFVFCLLWYVVDYFFVLEYNRSLPAGRNLEHTWRVEVSLLPEEAEDYLAGESDSTALENNFERVLDRIRQYPGTESFTVLEQSNAPGSGGADCQRYMNPQDTSRIGCVMSFLFDYRTDFFNVFRYATPDGKPVSVNDFDWSDPNAVVVGSLTEKKLSSAGNALGMTLQGVDNPEVNMSVKGVVGEYKRFDYERPSMSFYQPIRLNADNIPYMEIAVRSRDNIADAQFLRDFTETMKKELRIGNFYLDNVQSYSERMQQTDMEFGMTKDVQLHSAMMLFFLVNIMLCVGGTFWFRIRLRRGEIGLRMAMGSHHSGIRQLFVMEGLCMLALVTIPAMFIEFQFVYIDLIDTLGQYGDNKDGYLPDYTALRFILTNCLTWLLLAFAILLAVWLPANKAAKLAPAEALHYE